MGDDKRGIDFTVFDFLQQRLQIALHMRLTGLERQSFVHDRAKRNLVQ